MKAVKEEVEAKFHLVFERHHHFRKQRICIMMRIRPVAFRVYRGPKLLAEVDSLEEAIEIANEKEEV